MKNLIIHPKDSTTDFLKEIYRDIDDCTVITDTSMSTNELLNEIEKHDRIIMLGHGSPNGLFNTHPRKWNRDEGIFFINDYIVPYLKNKDNVYVWCNADKFVTRHYLKGLYTGMIISEYGEACMFNLSQVTKNQIEESNMLLSKAIRSTIWGNNLLTEVKTHYNGDNPIINFNKQNIYKV